MSICSLRVLLPLVAVLVVGCGPRPENVAENQLSRGKQQGAWTYRNAGGTPLATGSWAEDHQQGTWTWWWADGSIRHLGAYDKGLRTGTWRSWHETGHLAAVGDYALDRAEGPWRLWFPDGTVQATGAWRQGVRHGYWTVRNAAGQPVSAGVYSDGLAIGPWVRWKDGVATIEDLGVPAGMKAAWTEASGRRTWTAEGSARWILAYDQTWLLREGPGSLPADMGRFAADLTPLLPASSPVAPVVAEQSLRAAEAPDAPVAILPGLWTKAQEGLASALVTLYRNGEPAGDYGRTASNAGDPHGRTLVGTTLPQTRFLNHMGGVIDLRRATRPTVLVVMRGFSGQVCLYCATQTAALSTEAEKFAAAGVDLAVIYPGPTESVPAFINAVQTLQKEPPPMPVGLDVSLLLVRGLGITANLAKPTTLIVQPDGLVAWAYVGKDAADRPSVADMLTAVATVTKVRR